MQVNTSFVSSTLVSLVGSIDVNNTLQSIPSSVDLWCSVCQVGKDLARWLALSNGTLYWEFLQICILCGWGEEEI